MILALWLKVVSFVLVLPPSLSSASSKTSILESPLPTDLTPTNDASQLQSILRSLSSMTTSTVLPINVSNLTHTEVTGPLSSSPARFRRNQVLVPIHLRRCHSLKARNRINSDTSFESSQARVECKESLPVSERQSSVRRRRIHTENEVSSILILEQLSSILNDESAMLDGDEFDDIDYVEGGEDAEGIGAAVVNEGEIGDPLTSEVIKDVLEASSDVKQPLSNVDRYSMLGGQIN